MPVSEGMGTPGIFVTLEGLDGSGKSTQARLLVQDLEALGHRVLHTHEPGGTGVGQRLRSLLLDPHLGPLSPRAELLLMAADRAQHVDQVIVPALLAGEVVVCERYIDSSLAYQGGGLGLAAELVRRVNEVAAEGVEPHLTLLLDGPVDELLARAGRRDRFERRDPAFYQRVREAYLALAAAQPQRVVVINALAPVEAVRAQIRAAVRQRLGARLGWRQTG